MRRHRDDLGVGALLVLHPEHAERAHRDPAAGERRVVEEHQHVERVAVLREGVGHEAVVGRVHGRREKSTVEPDDVALVVVLVLVPAAARDLDHDVDEVPRSHGSTLTRPASIPGRRPECSLPRLAELGHGTDAVREGVGTARRPPRRGRARPPVHRPPPRARGHVAAGVRRPAACRSYRAPARPHHRHDGPQRADHRHRPAGEGPDLAPADGGARPQLRGVRHPPATRWASPARASCTSSGPSRGSPSRA